MHETIDSDYNEWYFYKYYIFNIKKNEILVYIVVACLFSFIEYGRFFDHDHI
jgi:hypothetical protein